MEQKTWNMLLSIASGLLLIAGLILLLVSIFGDTKDNWTLTMALFAIILANIFNFVRAQKIRKK